MPGLTPIQLWTDGSGTSKGPGGWAWVLVHEPSGTVREGHGGALEATNNRMELQAVIQGFKALTRPCAVTVYTDSEYVGKAFPQGWIASWKRKNWRGVKNVDLWQALDALVKVHDVRWKWVAGHTGVPLNESCDKRAGECRRAIKAALEQDSPISGLSFEIVDLPLGKQLALGA